MMPIGRAMGGLVAGLSIALSPLLTGPLAAQETDPKEVFVDLIHSDVPLWSDGLNFWPQHFVDGNDFGCSSRVAFGDWQLAWTSADVSWWRLENYGVFHCAILARSASEREDLSKMASEYSFFIQIGKAKIDGKPIELWALQMGTLPGSDYLLLARQPEEGIIKKFTMLQRRCPTGRVRKGPSMDIWGTEYCSINSRADLVKMSKRMLRRPALGALSLVEDGQDAVEPEN